MLVRISDYDLVDISKVEHLNIDERTINFYINGKNYDCIYNNEYEALYVFNNIIREKSAKDFRFYTDNQKKESEEDLRKEKAFEIFWNLYDKKHDYNKTKMTFIKLSLEEIKKAVTSVKKYVESTPNKAYRKTPRSWLLNKAWDNEIIIDKKKENRYVKPNYVTDER